MYIHGRRRSSRGRRAREGEEEPGGARSRTAGEAGEAESREVDQLGALHCLASHTPDGALPCWPAQVCRTGGHSLACVDPLWHSRALAKPLAGGAPLVGGISSAARMYPWLGHVCTPSPQASWQGRLGRARAQFFILLVCSPSPGAKRSTPASTSHAGSCKPP